MTQWNRFPRAVARAPDANLIGIPCLRSRDLQLHSRYRVILLGTALRCVEESVLLNPR